MKQNITLAIDTRLLKRIRAFAAERGTSVSGLFAEELQRIVERDAAYEKAKRRALADLRSPLHLGGKGIVDRDALHDRKNLR